MITLYTDLSTSRKIRLMRECCVGRATGVGWHVNALQTGKSDVFLSFNRNFQTPPFPCLSALFHDHSRHLQTFT